MITEEIIEEFRILGNNILKELKIISSQNAKIISVNEEQRRKSEIDSGARAAQTRLETDGVTIIDGKTVQLYSCRRCLVKKRTIEQFAASICQEPR